jgi:hypothetical protein
MVELDLFVVDLLNLRDQIRVVILHKLLSSPCVTNQRMNVVNLQSLSLALHLQTNRFFIVVRSR